jgi:Domain of unknown function (DUF4411)
VIYSVDTSALIEGWVRAYPIEVFPKLWSAVEKIIAEGRLIASVQVRHELERREDELLAWARQQEGLFQPLDETVQVAVQEVMSQFPGLVDIQRQRSTADPFVVALAKVRKATVLTQEVYSHRPEKPKIPDVCAALGVPHMKLLDLIRAEGWRF